MMYKFDKHLKEKSINWNKLTFKEPEIVDFFKKKFTSNINQIEFIPSHSTVKHGPKRIKINLETVKKAICRMTSNTPGIDSIPLSIIKGLKDEHLQIICNKFNQCLDEKNIPLNWKNGWVKLIPKREVNSLK